MYWLDAEDIYALSALLRWPAQPQRAGTPGSKAGEKRRFRTGLSEKATYWPLSFICQKLLKQHVQEAASFFGRRNAFRADREQTLGFGCPQLPENQG